jgi:C4-type Zn-finger protein
MARWVFSCPICKNEFTYSEIPRKIRLADYYLPVKPELPTQGVQLDCPSCKRPTTFFRHQLMYRAD